MNYFGRHVLKRAIGNQTSIIYFGVNVPVSELGTCICITKSALKTGLALISLSKSRLLVNYAIVSIRHCAHPRESVTLFKTSKPAPTPRPFVDMNWKLCIDVVECNPIQNILTAPEMLRHMTNPVICPSDNTRPLNVSCRLLNFDNSPAEATPVIIA